jgi:hypothetical protein
VLLDLSPKLSHGNYHFAPMLRGVWDEFHYGLRSYSMRSKPPSVLDLHPVPSEVIISDFPSLRRNDLSTDVGLQAILFLEPKFWPPFVCDRLIPQLFASFEPLRRADRSGQRHCSHIMAGFLRRKICVAGRFGWLAGEQQGRRQLQWWTLTKDILRIVKGLSY